MLQQDYGIEVPKAMQPELGLAVQQFSESVGREISSEEVRSFKEQFLEPKGPYELLAYWPRPDDADPTFIHGEVYLKVKNEERTLKADGNGPISAFVAAIRQALDVEFSVENYHEQAVGKGADAQALAFVPLKLNADRVVYGVGIDSNIDQAAVRNYCRV